jgi:arylsulfatase A-like enzyme
MSRFALMLFTVLGLANVAVAETKKPNIVLIFADDLGCQDAGFQGSDFYETPNLDALVKKGMVFTQAYAGAGNCAPSRACLLSGQYTPRHGVYAVGNTNRGPKELMRLIPIPNKSGLAKSQTTLADALKAAGYSTGIFGKWHLDGKEGAEPAEQGFDVVFDSKGQGNKNDPKGMFSITEKACAFLEANASKPFFCYVPHHGVHAPIQARAESIKRFEAKKPGTLHKDARYAASVYDLDDAVGKLLAKLRELKLEENTLVLFTSDNGGTRQSSQEPLRGNKGCYYEGGIKEPFIASWPKMITAGTKCDVPIHTVDLFPTMRELAGAAPLPALDGESLVPLLTGGRELKRQAIFWHFPGYLDNPVNRGRDPVFRTRPVSVIRQGDFKLHLYHEEWQLDGGREKLTTNNAVELYNLATDIKEEKNLVLTNIQKRDEMLNHLLKWLADTKAPLPTKPNPGYTGKAK